MKKNGYKISYDKESEVLSIEMKHVKSIDSEIRGGVVIDYDKNGEIVRINLYNFSFDAFQDNTKTLMDFSYHSNIPLHPMR